MIQIHRLEHSILALELVVEELIDVGKMVELQMTRLHKREVIAAGCREAFASRFGRFEAWEWNGMDERRAWWDAWESSCEELEEFQKEWGIPPCDECFLMPAMCGCLVVCRGCGEEHQRYAWAIYHQCRCPVSPCSPYIGEFKKKSGFFGPTDRGFSSFFIPIVVPSFPVQSGSAGRSLGSIRDSGFFVEFALFLASAALIVNRTNSSHNEPGQRRLGGASRLHSLPWRWW